MGWAKKELWIKLNSGMQFHGMKQENCDAILKDFLDKNPKAQALIVIIDGEEKKILVEKNQTAIC